MSILQQDYSEQPGVLRARLTKETQGDYPRFLSSLMPNYGLVWRDVALGYGVLLTVAWLMQWPSSPLVRAGLVLPGALLMGAPWHSCNSFSTRRPTTTWRQTSGSMTGSAIP